MLKRTFLLLAAPLTALVLLAGPSAGEATAQTAFGVQGNWGSEADFGVGGRVLANIPNVDLEGVGSVDLFFPGNEVNWLDVNANVFYHFHLDDSPSVVPYAGGGLNIARISVGDASTTETGLNIGGGVRFPSPGVTPFLEARAVVSDADQFVITGGVLFGPTSF